MCFTTDEITYRLTEMRKKQTNIEKKLIKKSKQKTKKHIDIGLCDGRMSS